MVYAWRHRRVQGASAYAWLVLMQTLMILGFILELLAPGMGGKLFWDKFQWIATCLSTIALAYFAIQYTEHKIRYPLALWGFVTSLPILMIIAVLTDPLHHFVYPNTLLDQKFIFPELHYSFTWLVHLLAIHGYVVVLFAVILLVRRFHRSPRLFRAQVIAIIIGVLLPILSTILVIFDIRITPLRDSTPVAAALGNVVVAWGLYRFHIFKVAPVGRDKVFEAMIDLVVILNKQNLVVDINRAMLDLMGLKSSEVIGRSAKLVFADFPIPIKMYTDVSYARVEASFPIRDKMVFYELSVWPLHDRDGQITGRVYVSHDITAMKELENELRSLNQALEQRVEARTKELAEAYDTTLEGWARTLELRDKETEGHSRRVTETTLKVARALDVHEEDLVHIRRGAILHDIGKMSIPDKILQKKGRLNEEERRIIQQHPATAYHLLERITFLKKALEIPYCHHEKWDGSGYPRGIKGRAIPLSARIFTVVDVWDAIQSNRPYNKAWTREKAIQYMREQAGIHFDPHIVDVFLRTVERGEI